jgi:hypothetical protein
MRVKTYKPMSWIFFRSEEATYYAETDTFKVRARTAPKNPRSANQTASRSFLTEAKRQWSMLSAADKKVWNDYARENLNMNKREQPVWWRGIDGFVRASIARQSAGVDAKPGLPQGPIPIEPTALDLLPGNNSRELVFRIEHQIQDIESHALLVRMTPTGKSEACSPYKSSLRHVRGVGKESLIALPTSGGTVSVADTRFELVPGMQYAIEVRILRLADGMASDPRYQAAKREEQPAEETVTLIRSPMDPQVPAITDNAQPQPDADLPDEKTEHPALVNLSAKRGSPEFPSAYVQRNYFL